MSRANVKPLIHWAIAKGCTIRFHDRSPERVTGVLTTVQGATPFAYDPVARIITLDGDSVTQPSATTIAINEYGWEEKKP